MLTRVVSCAGPVKVTFAVPGSGASVSVVLPSGRPHAFRYVPSAGHDVDDHEADGLSPDGFGETHSVIVT